MIIPFGKYSGQQVSHVYKINPGYLHWLTSRPWMIDKYPLLCKEIHSILTGDKGSAAAAELPREKILVLGRIREALSARGYSSNEIAKMTDILQRAV
jgi:hypothetical protein